MISSHSKTQRPICLALVTVFVLQTRLSTNSVPHSALQKAKLAFANMDGLMKQLLRLKQSQLEQLASAGCHILFGQQSSFDTSFVPTGWVIIERAQGTLVYGAFASAHAIAN